MRSTKPVRTRVGDSATASIRDREVAATGDWVRSYAERVQGQLDKRAWGTTPTMKHHDKKR
jgi:hypothetical protein